MYHLLISPPLHWQWHCSYGVWSHWVSWSLSCAAAWWVWFNIHITHPGNSVLFFLYIFFWVCNYLQMNLFFSAKMGSQVLVPFRGSEDNPRHLKLMGDLGQVMFFLLCLTQCFWGYVTNTFFCVECYALDRQTFDVCWLYIPGSTDEIWSKGWRLD